MNQDTDTGPIPDANGWLPIETYQTDAVKGPYAPHVFCGHSEKKWIRMGRYDLALKRWYYSGTNERSQWAQIEGDTPTHWQPLPKPPLHHTTKAEGAE